MNYAFVIDNRQCIGCHACSTACKSENDVPLGVHRTWVKQVELGVYPDVTRKFQVTRCNHCDNAPCVTICPTTAMRQNDNGIVDFDAAQCIGCKACIQACPYDAVHIDPETNTAAKCHFCAHRIDQNMEPACVTVCPTHAIIAGDTDNPASEISRILKQNETSVRKPEVGTRPKLFYIDGDQRLLQPESAGTHGNQFLFSDRVSNQNLVTSPAQNSQTAYNVTQEVPWKWPVPTYLLTKAISTGIFGIVSLMLALGLYSETSEFSFFANLIAMTFLGITLALLVYDLKQPLRFMKIVLRPQWKSWLTKGSFILMVYGALLFGALVGNLLGFNLGSLFWWSSFCFSVLSSIYTAFLFAQAKGRDMWQSKLLPWHLMIQSALAGSGVLIVLGNIFEPTVVANMNTVFLCSLVLHLLILLGESFMTHQRPNAKRAYFELAFGSFKVPFWAGAIGLGCVLPFALLSFDFFVSTAIVSSLTGLFVYEYGFVLIPQRIPNS